VTEGFPTHRQDDLRFYTDQDGRFTTALRAHYDPLRRDPKGRITFVKIGSSWVDVPFCVLAKGHVVRLMDADGTFVTWADDQSADLLLIDDPTRNRDGVWGVRARKPTTQELQDA